ncbi:MAG: hypothetical protein H0Z18_09160 [Thermococcus sp.]|uniref:hypothetical protein n=1 Tax=Thermococcus sp. TaxID=35749 RepID=UPI001DF9AC25|nr:hypothetical protein [Thermococcus sp.]MBO8175412.1 hypothetical protein [Thermococcus sp.]
MSLFRAVLEKAREVKRKLEAKARAYANVMAPPVNPSFLYQPIEWFKAKTDDLNKKVSAFIDVGAVVNVGVGLIVVGIIFLILGYITPEIDANLPTNTTWYTIWTSMQSYGSTAFKFIGLGFIIGGALYILRLVIGSLRNLF